MRPECHQIGKRGFPCEQRDPDIIEIERGRREPRQAQRNGEDDDCGDPCGKDGAFPAE